jgi:hypothetical protein
MQQIDFATKRADPTHIGALLLERLNTAPPLRYQPREDSADDLMTRSQFFCVSAGKPQVRLAQLL